MKKLIFLFAFLIFIQHESFSQIEEGNFELSISGTFGSVSQSRGSDDYGDSESYMVLILRTGYFIINSLEVEPEISITAVENAEPCFSLGANLAYNLKIPESNATPFALIGYGVGNSIPVINSLIYKQRDELDITHFNLGAGVKLFFNKSVAARIEYRYQYFSYTVDYSNYYYSSSTEYSMKFHKILIGFSVFL